MEMKEIVMGVFGEILDFIFGDFYIFVKRIVIQ